MAKPLHELDFNSTEEDLLDFCDTTIKEVGRDVARKSVEIEYIFDLLKIKQQQKLLDEQNTFNKKMFEINSVLAKATWVTAAIAFIALLSTFLFNFYQYRIEKNKTSFELMSGIEKELDSKINKDISYRIISDKKLLIVNGGKYQEDDLDNFLNEYESLGTFYNRKLITTNLICEWFGADLFLLFNNNEIINHIKESQEENPAYFDKLTFLKKDLVNKKCFSL